MDVGHSRLLKFFKESRDKPEMAETPEIPVIKIQKEYQSPPNVEAEVPSTHEIREYDGKTNSSDIPGTEDAKNTCSEKVTDTDDGNDTTSEIKVTGADFTLSPVITVTKKESSLTKGDMKLQKVTVTEDIAEQNSENGGYRISRETETLTHQRTNGQPSTTVDISKRRTEEIVTEEMEGEEKSQDEKKSKIPTRLKQAVERVKKEREAQKKSREQPRRSSIPRLTKDAKKVTVKRETSLNFTPMVDDEFDKLYEEIVDTKQKDVEEKLPSVTMEDPDKIETKFEEIIHAYDEGEHETPTVSRVSKIPSLRLKDDDGSSRLGALIDRAKEKSTITETKLKDGGFKVTASTIRTKRFSRGASKDLSSEQQAEVTEIIDIRKSGDNDVFEKKSVIKATPQSERTFRNITKSVVVESKTETVKNVEDESQQPHENLDKKDGTMNKTKRFNRTVSKETRERNLNRELSKNLEDIRREFKNRIQDSKIDPEFNDFDNYVITSKTIEKNAEFTPVKTERIIHDISKEINEDSKNINSTETVTIEELDDGGKRMITTITTESMKIGTPVVTEKVIRNISREISTESQNSSVKGVTTIEEITDEGGKKITTYVRENTSGIPVKTEMFARGISKDMGNIKQSITSKEKISPTTDHQQEIKKEAIRTEQIEKGSVKGEPVYTKVTRSFSKGKIQNVEMSRTVEWKPAAEVKTKNYSRSVSEKVTKKELKDAGKWKYEAPVVISEVTDINDEPTHKNHINITPIDPVLEGKIKETVQDVANKITSKMVTEFKSEEQVTNVEKTTYTLSSSLNLSLDSDFKASREVATQMSIDGEPADRNFKFVKEFGTQMSVENKPLNLPFDRDFKLANDKKFASKTTVEHSKASKEKSTNMNTVEKSIISSIYGESKASREFGTQMSVVGKIVDRDYKVSTEIGTQMSMEGNKLENYSYKASKENTINTEILTEKSELENSNSSTQDKNSEITEVTILKGNVSRLKDKITKETAVVMKIETEEDLPKTKTVSSKIAIFECLEPKEPHPVMETPTRRIKCKYVPPNLNRTVSADKPEIVDEILKEQSQSAPSGDTGRVEISVHYDEVIYRSEPAGVTEYWSTKSQNTSDIKQVTTKTESTLHTQQEVTGFETARILPAFIDFKPEESQVNTTKTPSDETKTQKKPGVIEMPTIIPAKINYEADIGKTKPGKINLNIWSTQVEINKSTVDKIDVFKEESLNEITQTLPRKLDFKAYESHVPVSSDLPGYIDFDKKAIQSESVTILPARINYESVEVSPTVAGKIDGKVDDSQINNNLSGIEQGYQPIDDIITLPAKINFKSNEIQTEDAKTLPGKIEVNNNQTGIAKTLTAFGYTSVTKDSKKAETNQKEVSTKPKPGKINLGLWQTQVETNKIFVGKNDIRKCKEAEMTKALSGRPDIFNRERKKARVTQTVQETNVLNKTEYKAVLAKASTVPIVNPVQVKEAHTVPGEIDFNVTENLAEEAKPIMGFVNLSSNETQQATIRTLPEIVNFSVGSSQAEVARTLPAKIDFSSSDYQVEEPNILMAEGRMEFDTKFENNEFKTEISDTVIDNIPITITENLNDSSTKFLAQNSVEKVGKLDLKAWEHQVEVNKTLVDKIDIVKSEHLEEIAKTLPAKIDFLTYESHVGTAKIFQAPIDSYVEENIAEMKRDIEADGNKEEDAKILPGSIEINPFKHTPRFNPLPMLIRLNSNENKAVGIESAHSNGDAKDNVYTVDIPIESNPVSPGFSDPELIDEDPTVDDKANTDSVIGSVKRKFSLVSNRSNVPDSTNTPMNTPVPIDIHGDNDYEKKVEELLTKSYSVNDIQHKSYEAKTVSSFTSVATEKTYKIRAETSFTHTTDSQQNNSATEYELSSGYKTVQDKVLISDRPEHNFITSPSDYKENLDDFDQNKPKKSVTNENEFNFDITRAENALTRSAYGADDFKATEELKRTKSLAELDLGDLVQGKVKRIIGRIKSVDFARRESVKTEINVKELPRKMTVLEKIALFEGKTARTRQEITTFRTSTIKKNTTPVISEEVYQRKIEELKAGMATFGKIEKMVYVTLADGNEMPVLALGTALLDLRLITHVIGTAIDMGYRAIDTAYIYGNEKEIGEAIKAKIDDGTVKREDLFIISKLWSTYHRTDLVEVACKASLKNLGLTYFDLYLIHNPMSFKEGPDPFPKMSNELQYSEHEYLDAWFGLEGLKTKGLVKSIGVSNFNAQQVQKILDKGTMKPVVIQVECHPYLTQEFLDSYCTERNLTLNCYGVLGSKGTPAEYKNSTTPVVDDALIKVMASGMEVSPAQLLIRYQIERGHTVVVKASSAAHLWDNLQALTFSLDKSQISILNALNRNKRTFTFKGMGDTHKNYPFSETN